MNGTSLQTVTDCGAFALSATGELYAVARDVYDEYGEFAGLIRVVVRRTGEEVASICRRFCSFSELSFTTDGGHLIANSKLVSLDSSRNPSILHYDLSDGIGPPGGSIALPPTGDLLAVISSVDNPETSRDVERTIELQDRDSGRVLHRLVVRTDDHIAPILLSPDGKCLLCYAVVSKSDRVWDITHRLLLFDLTTARLCWDCPIDSPICGSAFSPDGAHLAIGDSANVVQLIETVSGSRVARYHCRASPSFVWLPSPPHCLRVADGADGRNIIDLKLYKSGQVPHFNKP